MTLDDEIEQARAHLEATMSAGEVKVALRPCPFCGGDETSHGYVDYGTYSFGNVECHSCEAVVTADTETKAIAAWNTRAAQADADALVRKMREVMSALLSVTQDTGPRADDRVRQWVYASLTARAALAEADAWLAGREG
jgi:Lar family restriction alleviation protein